MIVGSMGIDVHGYARIGMSHPILQAFNVHTGMGHLGTEGMPEHMGCDFRQRLIRMQLAVLFHSPLKMMFNMHRHLWTAVLVQKKESGVTINVSVLSCIQKWLLLLCEPNGICRKGCSFG